MTSLSWLRGWQLNTSVIPEPSAPLALPHHTSGNLQPIFTNFADHLLSVDKNIHGKGIGRASIDKARSIRDVLELDVFKDNVIGRKFYEKYGFSQVDERLHAETGLMQLRLKLHC